MPRCRMPCLTPRNTSNSSANGIIRRHREIHPHLKATPYCWVEKIGVIRGSDEQASRRPVIDFLKKDRYQPFELAHIGCIVPPLCNGIEFIE